jgi:hypothetical protein
MVMMGGVFLLVAAALVARVNDVGSADLPIAAVIDGDAAKLLHVQQSAQPVPGVGPADRG